MKPEREQKGETKQSGWGFRGKTVWDWMDLLIVPLVLVGIGLVFSMLQDTRQQNLENQRQEQALVIENQRAKADRELAEQRAQDESLQAYLDQMSLLILDRKLLEAEPGDPVYTLAQARTATAMQRLNGQRNSNVIGFLNKVRLIGQGPYSIHLLAGIDLRDAGLHGATLSSTDLSEATLNRANLSSANLKAANLDYARLRDADLAPGFLSGATLRGAYLDGANLKGAYLDGANLKGAYLHSANLSGASLKGAYLRYTNLSGANLSSANLSEAEGLTDEHIAAAYSLEGATMPNGQKYEDWLKDREPPEGPPEG